MHAALTGTEICVFDAYGTLYDFNSAVARHRAAIGPAADQLSEMWRSKQIQYTWLRNSMKAYQPFWNVTAEALDHCLNFHNITDLSVRSALLDSYLVLEPYPEVPAMIADLTRRGMRMAILSNGNPEMLAPMVANSRLAGAFEQVLSVHEVEVFKPDPLVYALVEARCGVSADKVCFLSSNCWDAHGAAHFGFRTVWVNRAGVPDDGLPGRPLGQLRDLSQLSELLGTS
jgi:2-haloacid dehalogenase